MRYATGLPTAEFADLLTRLREEEVEGYPPSLGLRDSPRAAPIRMHHNVVHAVHVVHAVIGEQSGVCRPTISRAIEAMTDAIIRALKDVLLTAGEVPEGCDFCLDGTLLPPAEVGGITANCGRGERGTTGMSVRILVLSGGRLVGGLRPLLGAHARRGRPRRLPDCSRESTPPDGSPTRAISEGE